MSKQYYQIMGTHMTLGTVLANSFNGALAEWAREKGYSSWAEYRDYVGIGKVDFDGGFRITLR